MNLLKTKDVMNWLRISRTKLWQLVKEHDLPHLRFGKKGQLHFPKEDIETWLKFQKVNAPPVEELLTEKELAQDWVKRLLEKRQVAKAVQKTAEL